MLESQSLTVQGVRRFKCIGSDCELTCCSGWKVEVDQVHLTALQAAVGHSRAAREELTSAIEPPRAGAQAFLKLRANGDCAFLAPDRLCSLQVRFGEEILPNACAQFPRALGTVGDRREMWGSLSCPEMARLCLLPEDGMDFVQAEEPFSRPLVRRTLKHPAQPYERYLGDVRKAVIELLMQRGYPISVRFFFVAYLGKRTESFFHDAAETLDEKLLAAELARLRAPGILDQWTEACSVLEVPAWVAANVVTAILQARLQRTLGPLIASVLRSYVGEGGVTDDGAGVLKVDSQAVWQAYRGRRATWQAICPHRIDQIFEHHARNYWLKDWYVLSPNLLAHHLKYLCQAAVARFLLFGHPDLAAVATLGDRAAQEQVLDRVAVDVISRVARAIEHDLAFVERVQAGFVSGGMQDFAHATILAIA